MRANLRDRLLPDYDLHVAIQSIEKMHQPLDGKTIQVVVDQGKILGWLMSNSRAAAVCDKRRDVGSGVILTGGEPTVLFH